jgi:hypothetical protein
MRRLVFPVCLTGILVACGGSATPDAQTAATSQAAATSDATSDAPATTVGSQADPTAPAASAADEAPALVPEALQFTAPLLGGGDIELTTLAGRPVLLWFWAPW